MSPIDSLPSYSSAAAVRPGLDTQSYNRAVRAHAAAAARGFRVRPLLTGYLFWFGGATVEAYCTALYALALGDGSGPLPLGGRDDLERVPALLELARLAGLSPWAALGVVDAASESPGWTPDPDPAALGRRLPGVGACDSREYAAGVALGGAFAALESEDA